MKCCNYCEGQEKTYMKCPICQESYANHQTKKACGIECWCKNCYWCGHQIQMVDWAIDMDHDDANKHNGETNSPAALLRQYDMARQVDRAIERDAFPNK